MLSLYKLIFIGAVLLFPAYVPAGMISVRDDATVDVPKGSVTPEIKADARRKAMEKAWSRYLSNNNNVSRTRQAVENAAQLRAMLDTLCSFEFYDEAFDKKAKAFSLSVRASCDEDRINGAFRSFAQTKQSGADSGEGRRPRVTVSFVFLGRRAASEETTLSDKSNTVSTSAAEGGVDSSAASRGGGRTNSSENVAVTQRSKVTATNSDSEYKFVVESTDDAMTAVANTLQSNGFRIRRYPELVTECPGPSIGELSRRYAEMSVNTAWSPQVLKDIFAAVRQCNVPYFAMGLVEIGKSQQNGGIWDVTVSLNVKVNDFTDGQNSECASMSNKQYSANGRDRLEATRKALNIVAQKGTQDMIDLMRDNCF